MIVSAKAAARNIKALEDVMITQTKLDRVSASGDYRPQSINTKASNRDLVYVSAGTSEYQVARISCVSVDFGYVTGVKQRSNVLQLLEGTSWTNLISNGISGATTNHNQEECDYEVFHKISVVREVKRLFLDDAVQSGVTEEHRRYLALRLAIACASL